MSTENNSHKDLKKSEKKHLEQNIKTEDHPTEIETFKEKKDKDDNKANYKSPETTGKRKKDINDNFKEILQNIIDKISENKNYLLDLRSIIREKTDRDKYKDESILRMQKQINEYEKDLKISIKETLIKEILSFYITFLDFQKKFSKDENQNLIDEIDYLETELSNILFNNGINEIELIEGDELDRMQQRIKSKLLTDDTSRDKTIHKILKKGFVWNDKVIQKQEVEIYITNKEETNE